MAEITFEQKKVTGKQCPEFRVSYPSVFKAKSFDGSEPKYSCVMLFDKSVDLKELKRAVHWAAVEKWGEKAQWPKSLRMPFRNGDEKTDQDAYKGKTFITASCKKPPAVLNRSLGAITEESGEFYAGCFAKASLIAFAYDTKGNKGVSFALQAVQKIRDGESLSKGSNLENDFDSVEDGSDDSSNFDDNSDDFS